MTVIGRKGLVSIVTIDEYICDLLLFKVSMLACNIYEIEMSVVSSLIFDGSSWVDQNFILQDILISGRELFRLVQSIIESVYSIIMEFAIVDSFDLEMILQDIYSHQLSSMAEIYLLNDE